MKNVHTFGQVHITYFWINGLVKVSVFWTEILALYSRTHLQPKKNINKMIERAPLIQNLKLFTVLQYWKVAILSIMTRYL